MITDIHYYPEILKVAAASILLGRKEMGLNIRFHEQKDI